MIHEIAPQLMDNQYRECEPEEESRICIFRGRSILIRTQGEEMAFPLYQNLKEKVNHLIYLFSISQVKYFMAEFWPSISEEEQEAEGFSYVAWQAIRDKKPVHEAFAAMTALHLAVWYRSVRYCGCCGTKAVHDKKERMMRCPACNNMMFPKINPAIIVAVTDGERLLLTRYAAEKKKHSYALVAGFIEIGETAEECVARELLEETGVHVTDIQYYGSQPWGFAGNLMMGFTARLDGSHHIELDQNELSEAVWLRPEEIPDIPDYSSLTREMIRRFKHGELF